MGKFYKYSIISIFLISGCAPHYMRGTHGGLSERDRNRVVYTARKYLGVKYKYGGSTPAGFDCSGFVMYIYKKNGLNLPRTVQGQYAKGRKITIRRARPGDLVFFNTSRRKRFSHVGIYLGRNKFIHAPRTGKRVSITTMRNRYWKRRYIGAVTYFLGRRYSRRRYSGGPRYNNRSERMEIKTFKW